MYQNYIFDLYGTLVDIRTKENLPSLWQKLALYFSLHGASYAAGELKRRYAALVKEETKSLLEQTGRPEDEIEIKLEKVFERLYLEKHAVISGGLTLDGLALETMLVFRALSMRKLRLFEGVLETLKELKKRGRNVYLLSNAQSAMTSREVDMLGLTPYFDGMVFSSEVGCKKPSFDFYDCLFARYGLKKEKSVMVGNDDVADAWGAAKYGIDSLYIHTEQSPGRSGKLPENCREIFSIRGIFPR